MVVPGVESLDNPSSAGSEREPLGADQAVAAEFDQELGGLGRVVAGVEVDRDVVEQPDPSTF